MWHEGTIGIPKDGNSRIAHYWVKTYSKKNKNGINGGKISKLSIKIDGKFTANYDRGWDLYPADDDKDTQLAYCILLNDYN